MKDILLAIFNIVFHILCIMLPLIAVVAYLSFIERKVIGFMQSRIGPHRVGPYGLLQPVADVIKLFLKEFIIPSQANRVLFLLAPVIVVAPSIAAWAVIPFAPGYVLADINIGLLYVLTLTSAAVYGIIIAGWSSNSKYALLGAMRSVAQVVSYEIAMGFSLIGVLMLSGSMNLSQIVYAQGGGVTSWFWLPLFPLFIIYWISAMAETNRLPFDVAEGESELVAGFHVEYGGIIFSLFFLAEYMNMVLVSVLATVLFLGGWLSPFEGLPNIQPYVAWVPKIGWLLLKSSIFLFLFLWSRATFPRYRYDQIMRLCWKVFIPLEACWLVVMTIILYKR